MLNTYGLKMSGIKAVASATKILQGYCNGVYEELFYDRHTGEVWTVTQVDIGYNSWTEYHDKQIIKICNLFYRRTMQEIADLIKERMDEFEGFFEV